MRKTAQRADIRELILDGVDLLLARYGYRKMTMEDLAQTVGIGKGTIYLHFSGKEDVTLCHIDRIVTEVVQRLQEIARTPGSGQTKIKEMLLIRVLHRFDRVLSYSQSLNELLSSLRQQLLSRRQAHFQRETEVFSRVLKEGKRMGELEFSRPAEEVAQTLIACTNAFLPYSLSARELGRREEIKDHVSRLADLLLTGLSPRTKKKTIHKKGAPV